MNREIKFKGYNFKTKEMFSAEEMAEDQLTLLTTGQFINVHSMNTKLSQIYPLTSMIPLQYINLDDKNGKEIYEGDILEGDVKNPCQWVVIWSYNGWYLDRYINGIKEEDHYGFRKDLEVIGNIYENPDLLKGL